MDDGRAVDGESTTGSPRLLSADGGWYLARTCHGCQCSRIRAVILATRPALCTAMADSPGARLVVQPVADRRTEAFGFRSGRARLPSHRPAYLALLRDIRDAVRQHAAAGQFPGGSKADRRAPDIANQHGSLSAFRHRRPRLRLGWNNGDRRAAGSDIQLDAEAPAVEGPFLQLVRNKGSTCARAGLRLICR